MKVKILKTPPQSEDPPPPEETPPSEPKDQPKPNEGKLSESTPPGTEDELKEEFVEVSEGVTVDEENGIIENVAILRPKEP